MSTILFIIAFIFLISFVYRILIANYTNRPEDLWIALGLFCAFLWVSHNAIVL